MGRTDSRARLLVLLTAFVIAATALLGRLAWWQVVRHDDLAEQARRQTSMRTEVPSRRGAIYDRSGVVVLATTVDRDRLVGSPDKLTSARRKAVVAELTRILHLDAAGRADVDAKLAGDKSYVVLARGIEPEIGEQIRAALADRRLEHVALEPEPTRIYPQAGGGPDSTLAAHLLGFVNRDGVGQYGVEQYYQDILSGEPRLVYAQKDSGARAIPESAVVAEPGVPGADLRLTIDAGLQLALEQELLGAWVADRAVSVSAVVLDPYTGEVYAEASYPSYDANDYRAIADQDPGRFIDPIISRVYEPGSVFKMLTAVAALESGVTSKTKIKDIKTLRLDGGKTHVENADQKGMGWITFEDAIAYSRNVVAAKVAIGLGPNTHDAAADLHEVWTRLGFGAPTGIDLSGEVSGLVRDPSITQWRQVDLANGAFGQGVAVTPMQLAQSFSAMLNGGRLVKPHVVRAIGQDEISMAPAPEVLDPTLTPTLMAMMNHVVTEVPFYRDRTLIPGYEVGGKTGTAQIWDSEKGTWKNLLYNYSFVGYIARKPHTPDLVIAVQIHEGRPTRAKVGLLEMPVMSFELFRRIAHDAITTPGLLSDRPAETSIVTTDQ